MATQYRLLCGCVVETGRERFVSQCAPHEEYWQKLHARAREELLAQRQAQAGAQMGESIVSVLVTP